MVDMPTQVRSIIINIDNGKRIFLQFEPQVVSGSVAATYNTDPAIGGTHENLMFSHTNNENFSLELRWNRILLVESSGSTNDVAGAKIVRDRNFIRSLLNPVALILDVVGGSPPLLNIRVPGVFDVYARLTSIDWEVPRRDPATGAIMELKMRCTFREDPQYRFNSDDIADVGYERS